MRSMRPFDNFEIVGNGKVTATETGRRMAGESTNSIDATGALMTGMVVRVMSELDQPAGSVEDRNGLVYEVMEETAQTAIPPLTLSNQDLFLTGVRSVLELQGGNQ